MIGEPINTLLLDSPVEEFVYNDQAVYVNIRVQSGPFGHLLMWGVFVCKGKFAYGFNKIPAKGTSMHGVIREQVLDMSNRLLTYGRKESAKLLISKV